MDYPMITVENVAGPGPGAYAGVAAYWLTHTQPFLDEGPHLELRCAPVPGGAPCTGTCSRLSVTNLETLIDIAIRHDVAHPRPGKPDMVAELYEQIDLYGRYEVSVQDDAPPWLAMACPYGRPSSVYCPGPHADRECVAQLVPDGTRAIQIGTLLQLAAGHEAARNRAIATAFGAAASAGLIAKINQLRQDLAHRQRQQIYTRDTADSTSVVGLASALADVYGQVITSLDQVVADA